MAGFELKFNIKDFSLDAQEVLKRANADGNKTLNSTERGELANILSQGGLSADDIKALEQLGYDFDAGEARAALSDDKAQEIDNEMNKGKGNNKALVDNQKEFESLKNIAFGEGNTYTQGQRDYALKLLMKNPEYRQQLEIEGLIQENQDLRAENDELIEENDSLRAEIEETQKELEEARGELEAANTAMAEMKDTIASIEGENKALAEDLKTALQGIVDLKKEKVSLGNQLKTVTAQLKKDEVSKVHAEKLYKEYKNKSSDINNKMKKLEKVVRDYTKKLKNNLEGKNKSLAQKIADGVTGVLDGEWATKKVSHSKILSPAEVPALNAGFGL